MGELAPKNLTQTGRREITHLLRSHDLTVSAITCPLRRGLDVAENLEPRLEHIREVMALAYDLGPRLVIMPVGKLPSPVVEKATGEPPVATGGILLPTSQTSPEALLKESLEALGKHGDRTGVNIALEVGLDAPAEVNAYLERYSAGSLGVDFNPANLLLNGSNHAQDARRISPSKLTTVPLGHGDIDWLQILAHFEEIDYRGHLTVLAGDRSEGAEGVAFLARLVR
jgi:L-ribulose-5-phosphate 3-epimerase